MKKAMLIVIALVGVLIGLGVAAIRTGVYNVAADEPHSSLVHGLLESVRVRSIAARAASIVTPDLQDSARIRRGAGNYDAMCASCHRAPGVPDSGLAGGLYPAPPDFTQVADIDAAQAFWVVKHGIKASGMPAWGWHMGDSYIWDLVAFIRKLPSLSAEQYAAEVVASGGHSHGEEASKDHSDDGGAEHEHASEQPAAATLHTHADGQQHVHAAPATTPLEVAKALHDALSSGNARRVQDLLDPKVLILESGNAERSRDEYAAHHLSSDLEFSKATTYELQRQTGDTLGDLAWVASEARSTGSRGGKPVDVMSVETLVLRKSAAGWKVVHIHWSSRNFRKA